MSPEVILEAAGARPVDDGYRQYICRACGLVYDEERGDPDSGLAPGTRFEDIPDDWECPLCGVTKGDFEPCIALARDEPSRGCTVVGPSRRHQAGVVIVGAGTAGWAMAEAMRLVDAHIPITIVSGCTGDRYDKPLLSVALARSIGIRSLVKETGAAAARRLGVRLMAETVAVSVTPGCDTLRTTRGTVRYDHLVLAHGAQPRQDARLPASLCWTLNDLRCYTRFREALDRPGCSQRIAIIGAGLVGCEIANDLSVAGHSVSLLDVAERPLAGLLAPDDSQALLDAWRPLPLHFLGGMRVRSLGWEGGAIAVHTEAGRVLHADHVLSATGLETPDRLAMSAGLRWHHGIAVHPRTLATSVDNIHALGDCVSIDGKPLRYIEPIARQARVIASRIDGRAHLEYDHVAPVVRVKTSSRAFTARLPGVAPMHPVPNL